MTRLLLVILVLAAAGHAAAAPDGGALYFQGKVDAAEAAFRATLDAPGGTPLQKSQAASGLARIAWLVDGDAAKALQALDRAPGADPDACRTLALRLRILREAGRPAEAVRVSAMRAQVCATASERALIATETARDDLDAGSPAAALVALGQIDADHAVAPDVQTLRLDLALRSSDVKAALAAWRGFFWLTGAQNRPQGMETDDARVPGVFTAGLGDHATVADRIALERLLILGGFYRQALAYDRAHGVAAAAGDRADYRPIQAYFTLRQTLEPLTLAFDRQAARGRGDGDGYIAAVATALLSAARVVEPGATDPDEPLKHAFGLHGALGLTGGYASLHAGHVVQDERMETVQGGRRGAVRFIAIDNMISNGFESWLWDGSSATGGWSTDAAIVQVRGAYTSTTLQGLDAVQEAETPAALARQAALDAQDLHLGDAPGPVYRPGEAARMALRARQQVAVAARAEADRTGEPFAQVFAHRYWDAVLQHSIRVHEGRHALDQQSYPAPKGLDGPELEYRAKLSELEYADYPELALANLFSANMGDGTPHGIANLRLIKGLTAWMGAHAGEIPGFDPAKPAELQLDKVSDAQLRAFANSVDPEERR